MAAYKKVFAVFFLFCILFLLQYFFSLPVYATEQICNESTGDDCHIAQQQHNCAPDNEEEECTFTIDSNGKACTPKDVYSWWSNDGCLPEACIESECANHSSITVNVKDINNSSVTPAIPIYDGSNELGIGGPFTVNFNLTVDDTFYPSAIFSIQVPASYIAVGPTSQTVTSNQFGANATFQVESLPSISGNVFGDTNKNGIEDNGETNYTTTPPAITISPNNGTITTNGGSYTIQGLTPGTTYTVTYGGPPANYYMTSPLTGPPISFQVTVGPTGCTANGAPGASCDAQGDVTNLNFGISNTYPWFQSTCGDIRNDNGIIDNLPAGQYLIASSAPTCATGVAFTGNINTSLGSGQASPVVGGATYPEVYPTSYSPLSTSYPSLVAKATNAGITPIDVTTTSSGCTLSSCTLPATLAHGLYTANGNLTLNAFTVPAGGNYVFLVNGNLTINGPITVPVGSTAIFSVNGNITVSPTVGAATPGTTTSELAGWYVAGGSFLLPSGGNCTDLRLNIAGSVVVNALGTGGSFQNSRDLCGSDTADPTVSFIQRLDMLMDAPQFLETQQTISQEVSP